MNRLFSGHIANRRISSLKIHRRYKSLSDKYDGREVERNAAAFDRHNKKLFPDSQKKVHGVKYNSILPPPNVTGNLHLGHALMVTVQDVICRWKHFNGYDVQWIPGMDHAGIATQVVVEQQLKRELGVSRFEIGKKEFLQKILKWKNEKGNSIKDDILKMGTIFNWEKEYFTMDEHQSAAVVEAFIQLFEKNLIYRKEALVNWSCSLKSAISDIEVENLPIDGPTKITVPGYDKEILFGEIYNLSYKLSNSNEQISVATTRPETLLGDVAVAVHPNDHRYAHLRNNNTFLWHPFRNEEIPLIFDDAVNPAFGSGAVKITPAHSKVDYDIAQRHSLSIVPVIDAEGKILKNFEGFAELRRFDAREKILNDLADLNLYQSKSDHKLELPICSRSKDVVELLIKPQWFMKCSHLAQSAMEAVDNGTLIFDPPRFENDWKNWLNKSVDWCLSRQIWWGHQIPAYQCTYEGRTLWIAAHNEDEAREKAFEKLKVTSPNCSSKDIHICQDEDVLDTWFSSGILPFSLNGWPNGQSQSSKNFPLDVLVSGHDILFFWVARMAMLSLHFKQDVPFRKILLHGIVCDSEGKKMSKSRGNVITPTQIFNGASLTELKDDLKRLHKEGILTNKELVKSLQMKELAFPSGIPYCGVDALRFTLCNSDVREHFIKFNVKECADNHRFLNKIWNATKFTLMNCDIYSVDPLSNPEIPRNRLSNLDRWILSRLSNTLAETTNSLDCLDVGCAESWRVFFYENFCDVYVEAAKYNFINNFQDESRIQCEILKTCLTIGLRHMGVFTPFISNELLNHLPNQMEFNVKDWVDVELENEVAEVLDICSKIRQTKSIQKILRKHGPTNYLFATDAKLLHSFEKFKSVINTLTFSTDTIILPMSIEQYENPEKLILSSILNPSCSFGLTTDVEVKLIDVNQHNRKKLLALESELKEILDKVATAKYQKKAKPHRKERDTAKIKQIESQMKALSDMIN